MSLLIRGSSVCPLCGDVIKDDDDAVQFPAFAFDLPDPLIVFNDASVHSACLDKDRRKSRVEAIVAEYFANVGPGKRKCAVCGQEVRDPNDYVLIPRLVDDKSHPLFRYNYTHLHLSHVASWKELDAVLPLLRDLAVKSWRGPMLPSLIAVLEKAAAVSA